MSRRLASIVGRVLASAVVALLALAGGPSRAADVAVRVEATGAMALLTFDWGAPTTVTVTRDGRVARARFSRAGITAADLFVATGRLAGWIADLDVGDRPDEVRIELRDGVTVDPAPAAAGTTVLALRRLPPPEPARTPTAVRGDRIPDAGRLLVEGDPELRVDVERRGRDLRIATEPPLPGDAAVQARSLARWVEGTTADGPSVLRLRLLPNVVAREDRAGPGRFALNLSVAAPRRPAPVPVPRPAAFPALVTTADPAGTPAGVPSLRPTSPTFAAAVVAPAAGPPPSAKVASAGGAEVAAFEWRRSVPAASFERADVLWVVFGGTAGDLAEASLPDPDTSGLRELPRVEGEDLVAYRFLRTRPEEPLHLTREGDLWRLGRGDGGTGEPVPVSRGLGDGLVLEATGRLATVGDPEVRDRLHLLLSDRPGVALAEPLSFVDLEFVPASTGVVWRALADGLQAEVKPDRLEFSRPGSAHAAAGDVPAPGSAAPHAPDVRQADDHAHPGAEPAPPAAAPTPAVATATPPAAAPLGLAGITADGRPLRQRRQDTLDDLAALRGEPAHAARLGLARLFLADAMAAEALATLDAAGTGGRGAPDGFATRGAAIRAVAEFLLGREPRGSELLAALPDRRDPELALWRAAAAAKAEDWGAAERELRTADRIWADYPPRLRFRLGLTVATVLARAGRTDPALAVVDRLATFADGPRERADLLLLKGDVLARDGRGAVAASAFADAAREGGSGAEVRARFLETTSARERGTLSADEALRRLGEQRLLWRGHPDEPRMLDALAALQADAGQPLAALETWQAALAREPGDASAEAMLGRMRGALQGALAADGARPDAPDPVSALALVKAYPTLLPEGEPARRAVGGLAGRLAGAGLPAQAAALLDGHLAAEAGAAPPTALLDLARYRLAADQPEAAQAVLRKLDGTTEPATASGRQLVRAEALLDLDRPEEAHRELEGVGGPAAARLRSTASWRLKAWPRLRAELLAESPAETASEPGREAERQARLAIAAARSEGGAASGPGSDQGPPADGVAAPLPGMITASSPPGTDARALVQGLGDRITALRAGLAAPGPGS